MIRAIIKWAVQFDSIRRTGRPTFSSVFIQNATKSGFKKTKVTKGYERLHIKIQQVIEEYEIYTNQRQFFPAAHNPEVAGSSPVPATTDP